MKKLYYFLALVGFVACSTDSIDVYDGDVADRDESNIATIAFDTEVDSSLADQFVKYFGESYADRDGLEVTLTGKMAKEDFADIKGIISLDMSGVTLIDGTLPTDAFANAALTKLVLPQTGSLLYVESGALNGIDVTSVIFESTVETFADNVVGDDNTTLTTITIESDLSKGMPVISTESFPERFTKDYDGYSTGTSTGAFDSGVTTTSDKGNIYVASNTLYIYKQDAVWSTYNLSEVSLTSEGFRTITVFVESAAATAASEAVADLENELIDVLGDEYSYMDSLDLVIMGTLISEDFDLFVDARFSSVDFSQCTIVGDILIQSITGTMEEDLVWDGNAIPTSAFNANSYLLGVVFPSALEAIGQNAFLSCTSLTSIAFPEGATADDIKLSHLAGTSFSKCTSLVSLSFINEAPLKTIAAYAFGGCTMVEGITIPESVDSLGIWIINASDVCEYVYLEWETADRIPEIYTTTRPFPGQFLFGADYYITIPDGTRELYEATNWSVFNLCEVSEVREAKEWVDLFYEDFSTLDTNIWSFESGFTHDNEVQYFVDTNAEIVDGKLVITAKEETIANKDYIPGVSNNWVALNEYADYTSSWISTVESFDFQYGRMEISAKIPSVYGVSPAIGTVGVSDEAWPLCGQANIVANYTDTYVASLIWCSANISTDTYANNLPKYWYDSILFESDEEKAAFGDEFHTWVMYWTSDQTDIYLLDDEENMYGYCDSTLILSVDHSYTTNGSGNSTNPFTSNSHCIGLGITLGDKAGSVSGLDLPVAMEIDYIKVTQEQWIYVSK